MATLTVPAGAVDVYSTLPESEPLLKSTSIMSTYDSGISVAAVEPSDLDDFLSYGNGTVAQWLNYIYWFLNGSGTAYRPTTTLPDILSSQSSILTSISNFLYSSGSYLDYDGDSSSTGQTGLAEYVRKGFLGLAVNIKAVTSAIQALDSTDYSIILSNIYSSVDGLETGLTSVNTAIGGVTTAVNNVRSSIQTVIAGLTAVNTSLGTVNTSVNTVDSSVNSMSGKLTGSSNASYLGISGQPVTSAAGQQLANINRMGFMGLGSHFRAASGSDVLLSNGTPGQTPADVTYSYLFRYGLLGLRSLLSGSETDNVYSSTLYDNNNITTTVNSTGLGPLLNTQLSNIGENLGHLAYVFASDEDIKLREDSQPLLDTTDSFYDDSDSNVKVSTNNVGSLKDIAGNFTSIIDADADIGDAFAVVSNSNTYRWFSSDTAMNLDSLGVAPADFEESTYDRLHREFNEIYFPDRVGGGN